MKKTSNNGQDGPCEAYGVPVEDLDKGFHYEYGVRVPNSRKTSEPDSEAKTSESILNVRAKVASASKK